ncbi:hypothetical protein [Streptomyces corynorhini]|uniref:DUF624 domain-containing protein n=1 Tax=Streptomyces corynorhini TaxID=2282652 RepID=A0A370BD86_9ACTN|nr:hypothetical protein [Streptomyces corynorhini]RDG37666.1 hypothetical protein DVH02_13485 [Streptomyces corynorhini]
MSHAPAPPRDRREPGEVFGPGFSLFADVLLVGLLTTLACLPVVTAPAAFAAAAACLGRSVDTGVPVGVGAYARRLRGLLSARTLAMGLLPPLLAVVVTADAALLRGALPGAVVMAPALALLTLGIAVVGLRATALTAPHRLSAREGLLRTVADPRGSLLLAGAVLLAALLVWSIPLLIPLLPGPLAFAATAVAARAGEVAGRD